jgi:2-oxoglutarate dehydrogenase E2 component (dihydrolipoamide succinyltransferase)
MSRLRKVIASRMVESLQVSAQLTTVVEVDVTRVARLRTFAKAAFEAARAPSCPSCPFFASPRWRPSRPPDGQREHRR